jgi:hypothetical protein
VRVPQKSEGSGSRDVLREQGERSSRSLPMNPSRPHGGRSVH